MRYQITVDPEYVKSLIGELVSINPKIYPGEPIYYFRSVLLMGIKDFKLSVVRGDGKEDGIRLHYVHQIAPSGTGKLSTPPKPYIATPAQWRQIYPDAVIASFGGVCMAVARGPKACLQGVRKGEPIVLLKKYYSERMGQETWLIGHSWCVAEEPRPQIERDPAIELP